MLIEAVKQLENGERQFSTQLFDHDFQFEYVAPLVKFFKTAAMSAGDFTADVSAQRDIEGQILNAQLKAVEDLKTEIAAGVRPKPGRDLYASEVSRGRRDNAYPRLLDFIAAASPCPVTRCDADCRATSYAQLHFLKNAFAAEIEAISAQSRATERFIEVETAKRTAGVVAQPENVAAALPARLLSQPS